MAIVIRTIPVLEGEVAKRFNRMVATDSKAEYDAPVSKQSVEAVRRIQERSRNFKFTPKPRSNND